MAMNCWEFKKCGRERGGTKVTELGVCPASEDRRLDGCNQGENGGRLCWLTKATLCNGQIQGDIYAKLGKCTRCDFFKKVYREEGKKFDFGMKFAEE